jgi:hypothetical protein
MTSPYSGILIKQSSTSREKWHVPPNKRCTLAAMLMAGRLFGSYDGTLDELEDLALKTRAFYKGGRSLLPHVLAPQMGLSAPDTTRLSMDDAKPATALQVQGRLTACFEQGGVALLCVDHDSTLVDGDVNGDHYVLGVNWERPRGGKDQRVIYLDPAVGGAGVLDFPALKGEALWGTPRKVYNVRSIRAVFRGDVAHT